MAALASSRNGTTGVKGLILYYGVYDLKTVQKSSFPFLHTYLRAFLGSAGMSEPKLLSESSPMAFISRALPPVLAIASECDTLHPQTQHYIAALRNAGVPCKLLFLSRAQYPRALHGFQPVPGNKAARAAFAAVLSFLASQQ